jgi:hypothetical protein
VTAPRKRTRKVVATEETQTVTFSRRRRAVAIEEDTREIEYPPLARAPGWSTVPLLSGAEFRAQRDDQKHATLEYLRVMASGDPRDDARAIACASLILRAGPGASPLERTLGRL